MTLSPEVCLRGVLDMLQNRITPALNDSFAAEGARLAGLVLAIITNGIDDAAAIRIAENAAIRALFRDAAGVVGDPGLAGKLQLAGGAEGSGYKLSELDADNGQLRGLLVDLHVAVEEQQGDKARAVDGRIWRMLKEFEAARAPRR
jgi:hypothetical protein